MKSTKQQQPITQHRGIATTQQLIIELLQLPIIAIVKQQLPMLVVIVVAAITLPIHFTILKVLVIDLSKFDLLDFMFEFQKMGFKHSSRY